MKTILICDVILSICIIGGGSAHSVIFFSACALIGMLAGSIGGACGTSLWMRKVPLERQGSIFALVGAAAMFMTPVVVVIGGFTAEKVFEPALASGGIWVDYIGALLGAGEGQGLSLLFVVCGFLSALLSLAGLTHRRFRNMERFVPDGR
jgi:diaminobutyrate-2-oxoglutarate transaminase